MNNAYANHRLSPSHTLSLTAVAAALALAAFPLFAQNPTQGQAQPYGQTQGQTQGQPQGQMYGQGQAQGQMQGQRQGQTQGQSQQGQMHGRSQGRTDSRDHQSRDAQSQVQFREGNRQVTVRSSIPDTPPNIDQYRVSFEDLDRQGRGYITRDQVPEDHALYHEFHLVDRNRDGRVTREELQNWR